MELKQPDSNDQGFASQHEVPAAEWYGVPAVPDSYVRRYRLLDLLDRSASCPVILVSGPAGSGKTSLVADWVASRNVSARTEWISFESDDEAFWPGVWGGLARLGVAMPFTSSVRGRAVMDRRQLTALSAAVAAHPSTVTLVADGYEMVSAEVADDLDFLLRHTGHRLQVVLVTRVDPVLPLYRYRLEETVAEVRMADLAFTDAEAAELLRAASVNLTAESVHALNRRTEGWVAGLRFASRLLKTSDDPDRAVADVVGDSGNIAEYLMGEVLAAQTPEVRDLLLSTSVPETLQPGLAETLGGRSASRTLAFLTRVNAFVEPVPGHRGCYRYHPFFRDLLRAELAYEAREQMQRLQRRAAEWFSHEGLLTASVTHYAVIGAWAEAAGEVVDGLAVGELLLNGPEGALSRTLRAMPEDVQSPEASIVRATMALAEGDRHRFSEELARVPDPPAHGSDERVRALSLAAAVLRAVRARYSEDPREAIELAEIAEEHLRERGGNTKPQSHPELLALVYASKGIAALRRNQLGRAYDIFTAGAGAARDPGAEALLAECVGYLALIACVRDQLRRARSLANRAVVIADGLGVPTSDRPSAAEVALAWVDVENYELVAAMDHIGLAERSDFLSGDPVARTLLALVKCRLLKARGDLTGAQSTLDHVASGLADHGAYLEERLHLEAARLRIATNDPASAILEVSGLGDCVSSEVALVTAQARLLEGDDDAAHEMLSEVLVRGTSRGTQVSGWLVEASLQLRRGSPDRAWAALGRALKLAANEGLRRPFLEAPALVSAVVEGNPDLRAQSGWLNIPSQRPGHAGSVSSAQVVHGEAPTSGDSVAVEPLTGKELEVLVHLAELLSTEEIASTMYVSVNTVRTHVRSILRKLGVSRRNAAVRRARELRLLPDLSPQRVFHP
jgi:LuxR family maltose regulon positive regulatory protein